MIRGASFAAVTPLVLAACAASGDPTGNLSAWPGLEGQMKAYYERADLPEDHRCRRARFEGVTRSRVVSEDPQRLVLDVRYFYAGSGGGGGGGGGRCHGFGQRTFTVAKTGDGFQVVDMTASVRDE